MPDSIAHLERRLSGGASNTDPGLSLGGAMSTVAGGKLLSQSATAGTPIAGVTVVDGAGNAAGNGVLSFAVAATTLTWTPPGGSAGDPVTVNADGRYTVYGSGGGTYLIVDVVTGSLPAGDVAQTYTVANIANQGWDDVPKSESWPGQTEYRCFYYQWTATAAGPAYGVLAWISQQATGADDLEIGLDPAGINGIATTVANETTAPAGVTFSAPLGEGSALNVGTLNPGDYFAVWEKRVVPAATTVASPSGRATITVQPRL